MIRDSQTNFWEAKALSGAATTVSDNTYDLGAPPVTNAPANDPFSGEPVAAILCVLVAAAFAANETYEFDIITSAAANLGSPTVLAKYVIDHSLLTAGAIVVMPAPRPLVAQRYLGLQAVLGGTSPSITVTSWLAPSAQGFAELRRTYGTKVTIL